MRVALAFVKWIFKKMFKGLLNFHEGFKHALCYETGMALFFWFIISLISSIVVMLLLAGLQYATGLDIPVQLWFAYIAACVFYLLYTCFDVMYTAFKAERAELFETIKNGK